MSDNINPGFLTHRDDLPYEVVEQLEKMAEEGAFGEGTEGFKVIFSGDAPEDSLPEEIKKDLADLQKRIVLSFVEGRCMDCQKKMENWPPPEDIDDDYSIDEGWSMYENPKADPPFFFSCPDCEKSAAIGGLENTLTVEFEEEEKDD